MLFFHRPLPRASKSNVIILTKLDNSMILLNLETVKYLEAIPDTLIYFINGESVIVKEKFDEVKKLATAFKVEILQKAMAKPD